MTDAAEKAKRKMSAAHAAMLAASDERVRLETEIDRHVFGRGLSLGPAALVEARGKVREAEVLATADYEQALIELRGANAQAAADARAKARLARKEARTSGKAPDIAGARKSAEDRAASVAAEEGRLAVARADARIALGRATVAAPDSKEFMRASADMLEAEKRVGEAEQRLRIFRDGAAQARAALAEVEHYDTLLAFQESEDAVAEAGETFSAAAQEALAGLRPRLDRFNLALAQAAARYQQLPPELRDSRSPHTAHKLGELFGSGGTPDVFRAADVVTKPEVF